MITCVTSFRPPGEVAWFRGVGRNGKRHADTHHTHHRRWVGGWREKRDDGGLGFLYIASPQQDDLGLLSYPSCRGADGGGGGRTRDRRDPVDLRADSQATVPSAPPV
ncbi:hypothetical protein PoB_001549100 [Plakobranchus ocellatus]|uniref:Uncharacterized protein n=1 Tax=Plakobranchus ocellatus TaxID=259542 RepID=A0AAV3YPC9_9GAST|nr:hypothetical protein PoB_001549100 [Plakobranchus ocellatus]